MSEPMITVDTGPAAGESRRGRVLRLAVRYILLIGVSIIALIPLWWLVLAAFRDQMVFNEADYQLWTPFAHLNLDNFGRLFTSTNFLRLVMNSLFVTSTTVLLQLVFSTLGGFALAKYRFVGKQTIMVMMLVTMMIPAPVLLAPLYELIFHLGLIDTHAGLIVPGLVSVFGMFLFRQSMVAIPDELLQAARVDGCSELGVWWHVALPVSRPMIGAFSLIAFMANWNSFLWPQVILQSFDQFTLPIGLNQLVGVYTEDYGALMAGTLLAILPVVVLFFLLQREFISGLTAGAVKG